MNKWHLYYESTNYCSLQENDLPQIFVAVFIEKPVPFLEDMLEKVAELDYPKQKLDLFVHNQVMKMCKH